MNCDGCYRYRHCWACDEWMGCKRTPVGDCFKCDQTKCPVLRGEKPTEPEHLEDI